MKDVQMVDVSELHTSEGVIHLQRKKERSDAYNQVDSSMPVIMCSERGQDKKKAKKEWFEDPRQAQARCPLRGSNTIPPDLVTETSVWRSPN